jgi:hypothetical protein
MSARHYLALSAIENNVNDLKELIGFLQTAISDCELTKAKPEKDPAVLLLSAQLAFATNTDTITSTKYNRMVTACKKEVLDDVSAIQSSENVH